jgi:predicted nucleic acid-binding protein
MRLVLFDAHAILLWTQKEPGYERVKSLLLACRENSITGYMSYINLGEVYYKTIRAVGLSQAKTFLDNFFRLPITLVLPDCDLIWKASEIKAEFSISYADCFAAATAVRYQATIVTGDPEFKRLGSLVKVEWVA